MSKIYVQEPRAALSPTWICLEGAFARFHASTTPPLFTRLTRHHFQGKGGGSRGRGFEPRST